MIAISHRTIVLVLIAGALAAVGLVFLGRATVDTGAARRSGAAAARQAGYFDGLRAGQAQGREEGRAEQEAAGLPSAAAAAAKRAFKDGYAAGVNDAFAGFDGGWETGVPYVITLERGTGATVYRIASRDRIEPAVDYFRCPGRRGVCSAPRK